ncbi:carboxyl transferase domain-containing protein [Gordonia sp. CPCC 206044]|uniref:acetyl-CoA carboxylase family protein n=1 Tax=Gordonia sp. CPCC 206044 TaxID=3140793 RepID=UPI003AF343C9
MTLMPDTLLVANRGEIAVRIIATAAALGIRTVAVHPADDRDCAHVTRADDAVELPGAGPTAYLDVQAVVDAAVRTGAQALHPGYGFLSENSMLAQRCAAAGITFVGPSPEALALFGDKTAARDHAASVGVPVPAAAAADDAHRFFDSLGPGAAVMVKARAGGGGRGMRPVTDTPDLEDALRRCSSEAQSAFGDGVVYVEQLYPDARHIEVQVAGDGAQTVTLGDRDCSVQRRRQKLIEIAPAPALSDTLREALHRAAVATVGKYRGLATVEFLVTGDDFVFLEVNPRLQVEHTVTEEVTGLDLVEIGLGLAVGRSVSDLGIADGVTLRGWALQARLNAETIGADGTVTPSSGILRRFAPPTGRGIRVDTHGYVGYSMNPRYDSLLAKVIVRGDDATLTGRAERALAQFDLDGVRTNRGVLRALLSQAGLMTGGLDTTYVDGHIGELLAAAPVDPVADPVDDIPADADLAAPAANAIVAAQAGVVVHVSVSPDDHVSAGAELLVLEAMKMEYVVRAERAGIVGDVMVKVGDAVATGEPLVVLDGDEAGTADDEAAGWSETDLARIRPDLAEVAERKHITLDEGRPSSVQRRHDKGMRTIRENIADLVDPESFTEYGGFVIAAQRARRTVDDLIASTPADGLVTGTATVSGTSVAILGYDYTVLAGTQGIHNHRKTDRLLQLALRQSLPVVVFAEGGGGRPGDTDTSAIAQLDVPTFRLMAELSGRVPTVAVVAGYCFAGNAALAAACDVIIATQDSSLGMSGPAMIEGAGLGAVAPRDVGPMSVQSPNGVVDVVVSDEVAAVQTAREYLRVAARIPAPEHSHADQRALRHLVPENRVRAYPMRPVLDILFDTDSVLEVRKEFGTGILTAFARLDGRPVGVLANNPGHLGGAIDGDAADKATRFLTLCEERSLPVISLVDTPGFMVGQEAERTATVRRFGAMFVAGARLSVPLIAVVLRKGYGLGAMAMTGGDLHAATLTVSWPTGEFGGMGLEGAVRLGFRKELDAIADPDARRARYEELLAGYYERGKALSVATVGEIDDVIDPADTRTVLVRALTSAD